MAYSPSRTAGRTEWRRPSVRLLVLLIVVAFVVPRIALLAAVSGGSAGDETWYFNRALSIIHGDGYAFDGMPTAFWPIGYPGFLALLYLVFPATRATGLVANFFLSAIVVICAYAIFRKLEMTIRWALFGTLVLTALPSFVLYQNLLLSEILTMALLSLATLFLLSARRRLDFFVSGVVFGLTTLVKSQIMFLPAFLLVFDMWERRDKKAVIAKYLLLLIGAAIVISPWTLRNYLVFNRLILVQSNGGYNLLDGNNAGNPWGGGENSDQFAARYPGIVNDVTKRLPDEIGMNDRAMAAALGFITAHPLAVSKRIPYKLYRFFRDDPEPARELTSSNSKNGQAPSWIASIALLSFWYYTVVMILAVLSFPIIFIKTSQTRVHFFLISEICYFALISVVFFGEGRFHIPILPAFVGCMLVTLHAAATKLRRPVPSVA